MVAFYQIEDVILTYRPETNDMGIIKQAFDNGCHLPEDMSGMLFIDIGAHIGAVSVLAAMRGAKVLAYEPASDNYRILVENSRGLDIMPYFSGIGNGPGRLFLDEYNTGQNSQFLMYPELDPDIFEDAEMIPLEKALPSDRDCDFMKVDCEGCENFVIDVIVDGLHQRINNLYIEFHCEDRREYIDKLLQFYTVEFLGYGYMFTRVAT